MPASKRARFDEHQQAYNGCKPKRRHTTVPSEQERARISEEGSEAVFETLLAAVQDAPNLPDELKKRLTKTYAEVFKQIGQLQHVVLNHIECTGSSPLDDGTAGGVGSQPPSTQDVADSNAASGQDSQKLGPEAEQELLCLASVVDNPPTGYMAALAKRLSCTTSVVRTHMHKARTSLRQLVTRNQRRINEFTDRVADRLAKLQASKRGDHADDTLVSNGNLQGLLTAYKNERLAKLRELLNADGGLASHGKAGALLRQMQGEQSIQVRIAQCRAVQSTTNQMALMSLVSSSFMDLSDKWLKQADADSQTTFCCHVLRMLAHVPMPVSMLASSQLERTVKRLSSHDRKCVACSAAAVMQRWQAMLSGDVISTRRAPNAAAAAADSMLRKAGKPTHVGSAAAAGTADTAAASNAAPQRIAAATGAMAKGSVTEQRASRPLTADEIIRARRKAAAAAKPAANRVNNFSALQQGPRHAHPGASAPVQRAPQSVAAQPLRARPSIAAPPQRTAQSTAVQPQRVPQNTAGPPQRASHGAAAPLQQASNMAAASRCNMASNAVDLASTAELDVHQQRRARWSARVAQVSQAAAPAAQGVQQTMTAASMPSNAAAVQQQWHAPPPPSSAQHSTAAAAAALPHDPRRRLSDSQMLSPPKAAYLLEIQQAVVRYNEHAQRHAALVKARQKHEAFEREHTAALMHRMIPPNRPWSTPPPIAQATAGAQNFVRLPAFGENSVQSGIEQMRELMEPPAKYSSRATIPPSPSECMEVASDISPVLVIPFTSAHDKAQFEKQNTQAWMDGVRLPSYVHPPPHIVADARRQQQEQQQQAYATSHAYSVASAPHYGSVGGNMHAAASSATSHGSYMRTSHASVPHASAASSSYAATHGQKQYYQGSLHSSGMQSQQSAVGGTPDVHAATSSTDYYARNISTPARNRDRQYHSDDYRARSTVYPAHRMSYHPRNTDYQTGNADYYERNGDYHARNDGYHARNDDYHAGNDDYHARNQDQHSRNSWQQWQ